MKMTGIMKTLMFTIPVMIINNYLCELQTPAIIPSEVYENPGGPAVNYLDMY